MDIKMAQRVLLAHRQLRGRATDAAQDLCFLPKTVKKKLLSRLLFNAENVL